jgi:hypothetical protein
LSVRSLSIFSLNAPKKDKNEKNRRHGRGGHAYGERSVAEDLTLGNVRLAGAKGKQADAKLIFSDSSKPRRAGRRS